MSSVDAGFFEAKTPSQFLSAAFRKTVANSGSIFIAAVAMLIPGSVIVLFGQYLMGKSGLQELFESMQSGRFDPTTFAFGWEMLVALAALLGGALVSGLSSFAAGAAVARMLAERALGREFGPGQAWDFVVGRLFKLIGGGIVAVFILVAGYMVAAIPGSILTAMVLAATGQMHAGAQPPMWANLISLVFIIPGFVVLSAYLVSMAPAAGVEDLGGIAAAFRSFRLVPGKFWHVAAALVLGGLVLLGPTAAIQSVVQFVFLDDLREHFGQANGMLIGNLPGTVLGLVVYPFMFTLMALIYFDLRGRQLEEDFTAYELALDVGGELPEGVVDPTLGDAPVVVGPWPSSEPSEASSGSHSDGS